MIDHRITVTRHAAVAISDIYKSAIEDEGGYIYRNISFADHGLNASRLTEENFTADIATGLGFYPRVTVVIDQANATNTGSLGAVRDAVANWSAAHPDLPVSFIWIVQAGLEEGSMEAAIEKILPLV